MTAAPAPALADLSPGYFALVMATGIVGIGLAEAGARPVAGVLLVLAALAYAVLAVLYVLRWVHHRERVRRDLRDPEVAFAYFTVVAATDVLAVGLMGTPAAPAAVVLLVVAAALWLVLGYVLPWEVLVVGDGSPVLARANGTWFVWSVASQSLAVGLSGLEGVPPHLAPLLGILTVLAWSVGTFLYAGIAVLVVLRIVHHGITPAGFEPPYWVAMGALAIAVVAGAGIVDMPAVPVVNAARELIGGTVVIFWCFALWLVPMLLGAGLWRHVVHRVPLRYTPALWSMVFPLGMIAVASMRLGRVEHLALIGELGVVLLAVALLAWLLVAAGLVGALVRRRRLSGAAAGGS